MCLFILNDSSRQFHYRDNSDRVVTCILLATSEIFEFKKCLPCGQQGVVEDFQVDAEGDVRKMRSEGVKRPPGAVYQSVKRSKFKTSPTLLSLHSGDLNTDHLNTQNYLNTELFEVWISIGSVFKWLVHVLCPMY